LVLGIYLFFDKNREYQNSSTELDLHQNILRVQSLLDSSIDTLAMDSISVTEIINHHIQFVNSSFEVKNEIGRSRIWIYFYHKRKSGLFKASPDFGWPVINSVSPFKIVIDSLNTNPKPKIVEYYYR
jgi:hypothetical protein